MSRSTFSLLTISVCVLAMVSVAQPAAASITRTYSVEPRTIDRTVIPGDIIQETITVANRFTHRVNMYVSVHGLVPAHKSDATTRAVLPRTESVFGDWVKVTQGVQKMAAEETITIDVAFRVPRDVEPGVYHGLLGFGSGLTRQKAEEQVTQGIAPSVVLRFTVPEPKVDAASALQFTTAPFILFATQPAMRYTIHNPGRTTVVPEGEVIIYNQRGEEVASVPVNPAAKSLAPGELLTVAKPVEVISRFGTYRAEARVDIAQANLAAVTVADTFWYTPWQWLVALLLGLLLLSTIVYWRLRKRYRIVTGNHGDAAQVPLHVYEGQSPAEDHDINLKT